MNFIESLLCAVFTLNNLFNPYQSSSKSDINNKDFQVNQYLDELYRTNAAISPYASPTNRKKAEIAHKEATKEAANTLLEELTIRNKSFEEAEKIANNSYLEAKEFYIKNKPLEKKDSLTSKRLNQYANDCIDNIPSYIINSKGKEIYIKAVLQSIEDNKTTFNAKNDGIKAYNEYIENESKNLRSLIKIYYPDIAVLKNPTKNFDGSMILDPNHINYVYGQDNNNNNNRSTDQTTPHINLRQK